MTKVERKALKTLRRLARYEELGGKLVTMPKGCRAALKQERLPFRAKADKAAKGDARFWSEVGWMLAYPLAVSLPKAIEDATFQVRNLRWVEATRAA